MTRQEITARIQELEQTRAEFERGSARVEGAIIELNRQLEALPETPVLEVEHEDGSIEEIETIPTTPMLASIK